MYATCPDLFLNVTKRSVLCASVLLIVASGCWQKRYNASGGRNETPVALAALVDTGSLPDNSLTAARTDGAYPPADAAATDGQEITFTLAEAPSENCRYQLEYELVGAADNTSLMRRINHHAATGGYVVRSADSAVKVCEPLPNGQLCKGLNRVRYGWRKDGPNTFAIRLPKLTIESLAQSERARGIEITCPTSAFFGGKAYLRGFVRGKDAQACRLEVDGVPVVLQGGEFEYMADKPLAQPLPWKITVTATFPDGQKLSMPFVARMGKEARLADLFEPAHKPVSKTFLPFATDSLWHDGALLKVPDGALAVPVALSVTRLRSTDLPPVPADIVNVTANGGGYRFLPHGTHFSLPAMVGIPFDSTLIPQGYGPEDVFTFFYDEHSQRWEALEKVDTDLAAHKVASLTDHFTDMINGVIKVPESPQTAGYTPTQLQGMKAADPSAGIVPIDPPSANNNGSANLSFPLKIPAGRMGMAPSLAILYNSQGGSGWLGLGWDLALPAVTIDTKLGVPRYMVDKESETYTMGGMELTPSANRNGFESRSAEKRFYPRTESGFSKIIRHGSSPSSYWWEVTDKSGGHTYYGGTPETGADAAYTLADSKGNIGYWALTMQTDVHGNNVKYYYTKQNDGSQQLTPVRIAYTGFGNTEGAYTVSFECLAEPRTDASIDCRLGFVRLNNRLLGKITVAYDGKIIRSYTMGYKQGAFFKTLLDKVTELDAAGNELYSNSFGYYDDVTQNGLYEPWTSSKNYETHDEGLSAGLLAKATLFDDRFTSIGGSKSAGGGGGGYIGVGLPGSVTSKKMTVGGNFGYSYGENRDIVKLMDVDGDGLPDKVFSRNGSLYYRSNKGIISNGNTFLFGGVRETTGAPDFISSGKSNTFSRGVEAHPIASLGYTRVTTTSKTSVYPSDFNGDGILDFVKKGRVLFGHFNNGTLSYSSNSGHTPVPIEGKSNIDEALIPDASLELEELTDQFPLHDAVRVWQAPYTGTISVNAPVSLIAPGQTAPDDGRDGVKVSIQYKGAIVWQQTIEADDYSVKTPTIGNLNIKKGDRLYFRLQSVFNGQADEVNWNPTIVYLTKNGAPALDTLFDANGLSVSEFNAASDFVDASSQYINIPLDGTILLNGSVSKPATSDNINVSLVQTDTLGVVTTLYSMELGQDAYANEPIVASFTARAGAQLQLLFTANTNIDWSRLKWSGQMKYVAAVGQNSVDVAQIPIVATLCMFPDIVTEAPVKVIDSTFTYRIVPFIKTKGNQSGQLSFSVKTENRLLAQKTLTIEADTLTSRDILTFNAQKGDRLFVEYHMSSRNMALNIASRSDSLIMGADTTFVQSSVYTTINDEHKAFGNLWRGWGQFVYNGNRDRANGPMDEDDLKIAVDKTTYENNPVEDISDNDELQNSGYHDGVDDIFVMMGYYPQYASFMGQDTLALVKRSVMQSTRRGLKDIRVESVVADGVGLPAITKVTKTKSDNYSANLYVGGGYSKTSTQMELDMMDVNGDRFPDVISNSTIQYTLPGGTLNETIAHGVGIHASGAEGYSFSIGGIATSAVTKLIKTGSLKSAYDAQKTAKATISFNGSFNTPEKVETSWIDINGDGLPDKVSRSGEVALNLGYSFAPLQKWPVNLIRNAENTTYGAGFGYSAKDGAFQGGVGLSRTESTLNEELTDLNGDGLPDIISGNTVKFNTGSGFSNPIGYKGLNGYDNSVSVGSSANTAFTYGFHVWWVRIVFSVEANGSVGLSRPKAQMCDINGDGFPDLIESDKDGEMTVKLSTINRTNLLKNVTRPLGASFELGYGRTANSYNDPNNRNVLSSVKLFDGLTGDGADTTLTTFTYGDPYYDRAQREFFGFAKVETHQHDTQNGNAVYRTASQTYNNRNYHKRQAVQEQTLADANGKLQTKVVNTYDLRDALTGTILDDATANTHPNPVFVALAQQQNLIYQGYDTPQITTSQTFNYDLLGNVTHFTDFADGREADRVQVKVTYHDLDAKYIKSLPKSMEVITVDGTVRKRSTVVDDKGNTTQINLYNSDGSAVTYDMAYDTYGNLIRITRPKNHKGERMFYEYTYDDVLHALVTGVTDAYGYSSSSSYDYATQAVARTIDLNNQQIRYSYDDAGRLATVTGPLEIAAGKPYTLAFDYAPLATVPYARTRHYDPQNGGDMETYTFMDGLLRPVQVKKSALLFDGKANTDIAGFTVSGKQQFDAFGRTVAAWQNIFEMSGNATAYNTAYHEVPPTRTTYDVNDRPLETTLPDGAKTTMTYNFADVDGIKMAATILTDALDRVVFTLTDARGRQRSTTQKTDAADVVTTFAYNPLGELTQVTNPLGQKTISTYDMLGRRTSVKQPDNGLTSFTYDPAGNLTEKVTANIRKNIPNGGAIKYTYDYERVVQIDYPKNLQNKVQYSYGAVGDANGRAGRLTLVQDASGGQEFFYSPLGQVAKTIRTLLVGPADVRTYIAESTYDTWNRITAMTYPDGETVTYRYDTAGNLQTVSGAKDGRTYAYVYRMGYDVNGRQVYMQYGNGAETTWSYDRQRQRLDGLAVSSAGTVVMDNSYRYDAVDNILGIVNKAPLPSSGLGCNGSHTYQYDQLNRLVAASGSYTGTNGTSAGYTLGMQYDVIGNILRKNQQHTLNGKSPGTTSHDMEYSYANVLSPNTPTQVGNKTYTYDVNGNPTLWEDADGNYRQMLWDEENRLMMINDNGMVSNYTYDHAGERAIKSYGGTQGVYVNGAPAGSVDHSGSNYTVYVSPYMVVNKQRFTKHIYAGTTRICSKIGTGTFNNQYRPGVFGITAGSINYMARAYQLAQSRQSYYQSLGIPPGPPTLKGIYGEPETTGTALPAAGTSATVPPGWPRQVVFAQPGGPPGPPVQWGDTITNATVEAGFGYTGTGAVEELDRFFYHPDHIGSSSVITNALGAVSECMAYMPFGEILASQKSTSYAVPYLFTSKELDSETGLYYFGARYYDPNEGRWWGVDPLAEKMPAWGAYVYCFNNPVRFIDPDGETPVGAIIEGIGAFVVTAGIDFLSNWIFSEGVGYKEAFNNISWGAAALDGLSTAAISFFVDGTGSAKYIAKIGNSKGGRMAIDIVKNMTVNIMMQIEKGASFNDINLTEEFLTATFSTLLSNGLGKKANELLESVKDSNQALYNKLNKLRRNIQNQKSEARIKSDSHKVDIAKSNANANAANYANEKIKVKLVSDGTAETGKQIYEKGKND